MVNQQDYFNHLGDNVLLGYEFNNIAVSLINCFEDSWLALQPNIFSLVFRNQSFNHQVFGNSQPPCPNIIQIELGHCAV